RCPAEHTRVTRDSNPAHLRCEHLLVCTLIPYTTLFRSYLMVHPGTYYWRAPSGATYLVDAHGTHQLPDLGVPGAADRHRRRCPRSEEHTSELQSRFDLVCRPLLEKKKIELRHPRVRLTW